MIRRSPVLVIILGLALAVLYARTNKVAPVKTAQSPVKAAPISKIDVIEQKLNERHEQEDIASDDPLKVEAQQVVESLLLHGNAGEVLTAIDLLKHFPAISKETRRQIARSLCRFQSQSDIEFELIRTRLLRSEKLAIDLSSCNG